jgi:hypothetical protein
VGITTVVITVLAAGTILGLTLSGGFNGPLGPTTTFAVTTTTPRIAFPVGIPNAAEPSGMAPPSATALPGYHLDYVNDFPGRELPSGWNVFYGLPSGDPGGQFGAAHTVVRNGMLQLNTWRDPQYNNKWVTGGICQCGFTHLYGAIFVRSRDTGAGPNEVELLWPANSHWPPEVDFNESGGSNVFTSWTLHYGITNSIDQQRVFVNMRQWHTWGVIWTPASMTFTVDGSVWGVVTNPSAIPATPMRLDIEQRAECGIHQQCPAAPVSLLVDWVAEYSPTQRG